MERILLREVFSHYAAPHVFVGACTAVLVMTLGGEYGFEERTEIVAAALICSIFFKVVSNKFPKMPQEIGLVHRIVGVIFLGSMMSSFLHSGMEGYVPESCRGCDDWEILNCKQEFEHRVFQQVFAMVLGETCNLVYTELYSKCCNLAHFSKLSITGLYKIVVSREGVLSL